jgi:hypothetical protein
MFASQRISASARKKVGSLISDLGRKKEADNVEAETRSLSGG